MGIEGWWVGIEGRWVGIEGRWVGIEGRWGEAHFRCLAQIPRRKLRRQLTKY